MSIIKVGKPCGLWHELPYFVLAYTAIFCFGLPCVISRGVLVCTAVHLGSSGNYASVTDKLLLVGKTLVFLDLIYWEYL